MPFTSGKTSDAGSIAHFFCYYILFAPKKSAINPSVIVNLSPVYVSYKSSGDLWVFIPIVFVAIFVV